MTELSENLEVQTQNQSMYARAIVRQSLQARLNIVRSRAFSGLKVAVVGSGPSGFYTAKSDSILLSHFLNMLTPVPPNPHSLSMDVE